MTMKELLQEQEELKGLKKEDFDTYSLEDIQEMINGNNKLREYKTIKKDDKILKDLDDIAITLKDVKKAKGIEILKENKKKSTSKKAPQSPKKAPKKEDKKKETKSTKKGNKKYKLTRVDTKDTVTVELIYSWKSQVLLINKQDDTLVFKVNKQFIKDGKFDIEDIHGESYTLLIEEIK